MLGRARFLAGRHAFVSYAHPGDLPLVADACSSFALDNGAFSAWRSGRPFDEPGFVAWVEEWHRHPGFDWAVIPDVIEGTEEENDAMVERWPAHLAGVPVWHYNESLDRLDRLVSAWPRVALGSSSAHPTGSEAWWRRTAEALDVACDADGHPRTRLHGLRMLDPKLFTRMPLASADSTNVLRTATSPERRRGSFGDYAAAPVAARCELIAGCIEQHNSAPTWERHDQLRLFATNGVSHA